MKDLILIGSGGCMTELLYQIENLNKEKPTWNVLGYVDKIEGNVENCVYLGDDDWLIHYQKKVNVCISVQESSLRKRLAVLYRKNSNLNFPVIRMNKTEIASSTVLGEGTILCEHVKITNDGQVGAFGFFNIGAQIHHGTKIADYVSVAPNVTIAGNVTIEREAYIGMRAVIIQSMHIGQKAIIGAGAVVTKDIPTNVTAVGVPAKIIKR